MKDSSVGIALQKKASQVSAGAEVLLAKVRDWQVIKQYLCNRFNDIPLTASQKKQLERYQFIYGQMVSGKYTDQEVLNQVMKFYTIGLAQAYEDMRATREIIPYAININKPFELQLEIQIAKKARIKCEEMDDMKTAAQYSKVIADLLKQIEHEDETPAELFEGHTIEAVFDPELLGAPPVDMKEILAAINAKRNKKVNIDLFEEIAFTNVSKEDNGG